MNQPMSLQALQIMLDGSPFIHLLQMRAVSLDVAAQRLVMDMPLTPGVERRAGTGQYHGGAIAALIDTAGDFALAILLGGPVPTIDLRIDYLRPAIGGELRAVATVRRAGRNVGVVDVDVTDPSGRLVAIGRGCYSMAVG
jgi:uncharacterized protein (TIGR00369 family)